MAAHAALAGSGPGRRWVTEEVNHALIVRLAGEFQGFTRDLHDQAIDAVLAAVPGLQQGTQTLLRASFEKGRKLDTGNASWANICSDFAVFGFSLKTETQARYLFKYPGWIQCLDKLNKARNAIAHQDSAQLAQVAAADPLTLGTFKAWRAKLNAVACGLDVVTSEQLRALNGTKPW